MGQLLAVARLNWEYNSANLQEIYGCYTIADIWKFIRAEIEEIELKRVKMELEFSREYSAKLEGETILRILKKVVAQYQ
jgi:hypothetical protein